MFSFPQSALGYRDRFSFALINESLKTSEGLLPFGHHQEELSPALETARVYIYGGLADFVFPFTAFMI